MNILKKVLLINDLTCMGKCSSMVNIPILSTLNIEVYFLPTALLSNHSYGFKSFFLKNLNYEIKSIIKHWILNDIKFDAIFIGCIIKKIDIKFLEKLIKNFSNEKTLIFIDPIIGENGILYKMYNIKHINFMKKLCLKANILTPNLTEACFLTNTQYIYKEYYDKKYIKNIIIQLYNQYNTVILLTGIKLFKNKISICIHDKKNISFINNIFIDTYYPGTGDIFCSAFLGLLLNKIDVKKSSKIAMKFIIKSILNTKTLNRDNKFGLYFENNLNFLYNNIKNK